MLENYRLKVFRAVAEQASFRRAAEQLRITQPSVSQHIRLLEEELSLRLFDRSPAGITLTPAGILLLDHTRRAGRLVQKTLTELAALQGQPGGSLRLAASTTVAQYVLPRILGAFLRANPRVQVSVTSGNTHHVTELVLAGHAHLGIIEGPPTHKEVSVEHFLDDRLLLAVPRNHPWAGLTDLPVTSLLQAPLLMRENGSGTRHVVEDALRHAGIRLNQLHIAMELDSTEAIVSGIEAGLGVGFLSRLAIRKELRLGTLATATIAGVQMPRAFSLIHTSGPLAEGSAAAFRTFALSQIASHLAPSTRKP